jgi:hypothetical protein
MDRYPQHIQTHADVEVESALVCIECLRPWLVSSERWRLKVTDDAVPVTVPYCPECAHREFD